jgi:TP901 family phage tail tape measure protein
MTVTELLIRVRAETAEAKAALGGLTSSMALLGVAAGVVAAGAFVKMGMDAQTELSKVQGLAGVSEQQMSSYTKSLEQMGGSMGVTLSEAAKGLYYVVSAGFSGADALNVLHGAMQASEASGADLADVTHGIAGALNAYGAKASEATKYTDIMTGAVTYGMQTYSEFAHEMGMATATAAAHKVPLIELAAAEASLTEKGLPAAAAFTGLAFAITKVQVPADEMGKTVRGMGGHFDAAKFSAMSFVDRLNYLHSATGISESDFIKLVGGTRSSKAALDLVGDSGKAYADVLTKLSNSAGLTARAFAVHDKTMADAFKDVGASISNAAYNFVQFVSPTVVPFLDKVTQALEYVTSHSNVLIPVMIGLGAAIAWLLVPPLWAAAGAMIALTWPAIAIGLAIGALVAVLIFAYTHWTGFRLVVDTVRDALGRFFSSLGPWMSALGSFVQSAIKWFQDLGAKIGASFDLAGRTIQSWISNVGSWFNQLGTNIHNFLDGIAKAFQGGWALIVSTVQNAIKFIVDTFMMLYNHSYVFQAIVDFIVSAFNGLRTILTNLWNAITGFLINQWNMVRAGAAIIWNFITTVIANAVNSARSVITSVWNAITSFIGGVFSHIGALARAAWDAFVSVILSAVGRASSAVHAVNDVIINTLKGIIGAVVGVGRAIVEGLIAGIRAMFGAVGSIIASLAGKIRDGLKGALGIHSPSEVTLEMGSMLGQGLINGLLAQDVPGQVAKHLRTVGGAAVGGINVGVSGGAVNTTGYASAGGGGGAQAIHIHNHLSLDGRELAGALGQPLVNEIRLRTGQRI